MAVTNSINMSLPIPTVGTELGPAYAFDINSALTLIDQHDHTPSRGVQITPAGLNINTDLQFNSQSAVGLLATVFNAQTLPTNTLQALSVAPGTETTPLQDLWYTDNAGNKVQITSGGALNAVTTTVLGITYSLGTFTFTQTQSGFPTTPANLDAGNITIRPLVPGTANGVTLTPPAGISSAYNIALPNPVVVPSFLTMDISNNISGSIPIAAGITQSNLANNSVGTAQIIDSNITTAKINNLAVTFAKLQALNIVSANSVPRNVGTTGPAWFSVLGNNITITAGTWRLTGAAYWEGPNPAGNTALGWFGAPGVDNNVTPAALVCTVLSGRIGRTPGFDITTPNAFFLSTITAATTIITVTVPTIVYLVQHGNSTGTNMVIDCWLSAEQLR